MERGNSRHVRCAAQVAKKRTVFNNLWSLPGDGQSKPKPDRVAAARSSSSSCTPPPRALPAACRCWGSVPAWNCCCLFRSSITTAVLMKTPPTTVLSAALTGCALGVFVQRVDVVGA